MLVGITNLEKTAKTMHSAPSISPLGEKGKKDSKGERRRSYGASHEIGHRPKRGFSGIETGIRGQPVPRQLKGESGNFGRNTPGEEMYGLRSKIRGAKSGKGNTLKERPPPGALGGKAHKRKKGGTTKKCAAVTRMRDLKGGHTSRPKDHRSQK